MDAVVQVFDVANETKLADLRVVDADGFERSFDDIRPTGEKLCEAGSGEVIAQADHPAMEHLVPGNVVRLCGDDGDGPEPVFSFRIGEDDIQVVAVSEKDLTVKLSGPGLLGDWERATVAPWMPGRPVSADRVWNWASPRGFDDSGWSTTVYVQSREPEWQPLWPAMFPVGPSDAKMVWTAPTAEWQTEGVKLFRLTLNITEPGDIASFHSADNASDVWASGVLLNRHTLTYPDRSGWQKTWREVVPVDAGTHVFAYAPDNWFMGAYLLVALLPVSDNGVVEGDLIAATGTTAWKWYDPGDGPKPGFTALQIVEMLLEEAQDRGMLTDWSIQSYGEFGNIEEFSARVGDSYLSVLESLALSEIDFAADTEGLVLHVWPKGGRDREPDVTLTVDAVDDAGLTVTDDVVTAVLVVWADGATWVERDDHPVLGRREASLHLGSVTDMGGVLRVANAFLDAHAEPALSVVGAFHDTPGFRAGVDYQVGDTIGCDVPGLPESLRCVGLTWTVDQRTGELLPNPEFDTPSGVLRRERQRAMDRASAAYNTAASAPLLTDDRLLISGYPSGSSVTWSWSGDVDELNDDDPDKPAQVWRPVETQRLWMFEVEIDQSDLPDAWGTTTIRLIRNGSVLSDYNLTLTTTVYRRQIQIWAGELARAGDIFRVQAYTQGGHVDGRVTLHYCDPV